MVASRPFRFKAEAVWSGLSSMFAGLPFGIGRTIAHNLTPCPAIVKQNLSRSMLCRFLNVSLDSLVHCGIVMVNQWQSRHCQPDETKGKNKMNIESKHSPSPWKLSHESTSHLATIRDSEGRWICDVVNCNGNARLIAAAPELLEACKVALSELGPESDGNNCWKAFSLLQSAVSKATKGE